MLGAPNRPSRVNGEPDRESGASDGENAYRENESVAFQAVGEIENHLPKEDFVRSLKVELFLSREYSCSIRCRSYNERSNLDISSEDSKEYFPGWL